MIRVVSSDERGQALVEFALVLPILLVLLFGVIQVGFVLHARQTIAYAARVAADSYAQTLSEAQADRTAVAAADALRPRLISPFASISYTIVSERMERQCVRRRFASCREYRDVVDRNERRTNASDRGAVGELVRARIVYSYPSPVRGAFGAMGLPADIPIEMDAIALIEASAPAAAPARTCYAVSSQQGYRSPAYQQVSVRIDGAPSARVRAGAGTSHRIEVVARLTEETRSYLGLAPGPADKVIGAQDVVLGDVLARVVIQGHTSWTSRQGWSASWGNHTTVTLTPSRTGACGADRDD